MLTRKGLATGLLGGLGAFAGLALDNPLFLLLGLLGLALLGIAALTPRRAEVRSARAIQAESAAEGDTVAIELRLEAARRHGRALLEVRDALPGEVELADGNNYTILDLKPHEVAVLRYAVRCPVKGHHRLGPLRVRVEDPLGLLAVDEDVGEPSVLKVYPRVEDLREVAARSKYPFVTAGPHLVGQPGQGSDFFALREYSRGDTMRDVDWKASARVQELMVRQRERESMTEVTILLDARAAAALGTVGENTFLYACRAAASLADLFLGQRSRVALVLYGEGLERVDRQVSRSLATDILEAVTRARAAGEESLAQAVELVLPTVRARTPVFLLSALLDDPGLERAVATLRAYDATVVVVSPSAPAFARLASRGAREDGASALEAEVLEAQRERAVAALRGMGAFVLDWQPGQSLAATIARGVA